MRQTGGMRDSMWWKIVVFAIPAIVFALGIQFFVRKQYFSSGSFTAVLKPSSFKTAANLAATKNLEAKHTNNLRAPAKVTEEQMNKLAQAEEPEDSEDVAENEHVATAPVAGAGNTCSSVEYRGEGPKLTKVTKGEWATVIDQFHSIKSELKGWIASHRKELPENTAESMAQIVANLKIQRPPVMEEPDLAWRGIGVMNRNENDELVIRLGSGFVKLVQKEPSRSKFELTRLVVQSVAPCELSRVKIAAIWDPLLKCLNVSEEGACQASSYSEGGWAVSTAIADIIAPPGCKVPAFVDAKMAACLQHIPFPLSLNAQLQERSHGDQI